MWINRNVQTPPKEGVYRVFGSVNAGTEYEVKTGFYARYIDERFTDLDGDDFTQINKGVEYWFDFDKVKEPVNPIQIEL